jgi:hypothetical protein
LFGNSTAGLNYTENTTAINSPIRKEIFGGTGNVIPDAVGGVVVRNQEGQETGNFPESAFVEVKEVNAESDKFFGREFGNPLSLSSVEGQILGLVDIAGFSKAGMSTFTSSSPAPAMIIALTTSNTDFSKEMLDTSTAANVAVWQVKAYAVQDPDTGKWLMGFYPAELLNKEIAGDYLARKTLLMNPLPNGTGLGTPGRTRNLPVTENPDQTFQP